MNYNCKAKHHSILLSKFVLRRKYSYTFHYYIHYYYRNTLEILFDERINLKRIRKVDKILATYKPQLYSY